MVADCSGAVARARAWAERQRGAIADAEQALVALAGAS
jgi:hypothetical protein